MDLLRLKSSNHIAKSSQNPTSYDVTPPSAIARDSKRAEN
jgi:hypothetical protein